MSIVLTDPNLLRKAPTYARLLEIILVIPMSSVACERGASLLKRALSNLRTRLKATKLDAEMYIAANGAPVWEADIDAYVTAWRGKRPHKNTEKMTSKNINTSSTFDKLKEKHPRKWKRW